MTYEQIQKLPEYQKILDMGFEDTSSPVMKRRLSLRFANLPLFGEQSTDWNVAEPSSTPGYFVIHQNGYVRTHLNATPAPIPSLRSGPLEMPIDYSNKMEAFRKFTVAKFVKDAFGVSKRSIQQEIANQDSWEESVVEMWKRIPTSILHWIKEEDKTTQALFMNSEGSEVIIAKEIQKAPGKWVILLKSAYKSEVVTKAIALLPPEMSKSFSKDLNLVGDLNDLGL